MTEVLFMENLSHDITLMIFLSYLHQIKIRLYMRCQFNYKDLIGQHNFESMERKHLRKIVYMGKRSSDDDTEDVSNVSQDPLYYDLDISSDSNETLCPGSFLYYDTGLDQVPRIIEPNESDGYTIEMPLQSNEVVLSRRITCSGPVEKNISNVIYIIDSKSINKNHIFNKNNDSVDVHMEESKLHSTELAINEEKSIPNITNSQTHIIEDNNKFQVKMPQADTNSEPEIMTGSSEDVLIQTAPDIGAILTESTNSSNNLVKDLSKHGREPDAVVVIVGSQNVYPHLTKVSSDTIINEKDNVKKNDKMKDTPHQIKLSKNKKKKMRAAKKFNEKICKMKINNRQFGDRNTRMQLSPKTKENQIIAEIVDEVIEKCTKIPGAISEEVSALDRRLSDVQTNLEDFIVLPITKTKDDKFNQIEEEEVQIPGVNKILLDLTQSEKKKKRKRKRNNVSKRHFINRMDMMGKKNVVEYSRKNNVSSEWNHAETIQFIKNEFLAATETDQKIFKSYKVENILKNVTNYQKKRNDCLFAETQFADRTEREVKIKCCLRSQIKSATAVDTVCETVLVDEQSVNLDTDGECKSSSKVILSGEEFFNITTINENFDIIDLNCSNLERKETSNSMNNKNILKPQMQNLQFENAVSESVKDLKDDINFKYTFENWNEIIDEVTATADNSSKANVIKSVFPPVQDISFAQNGGKINISKHKRYKDDYAQTDSQISPDYMATHFFINLNKETQTTSISIDILINDEQVYRFTPNIREGPNKMEIVLQNIDGNLKVKDLSSNPPGTFYNSLFTGDNSVTRAGKASPINAYAVSANRLDNVRHDDVKKSDIVGVSKLYDDKRLTELVDNLLSEETEDKSKATIMTVPRAANPFEGINVLPFDVHKGVSNAKALSNVKMRIAQANQKYKEYDCDNNHTFRTRCINPSRNMDSFRYDDSVKMGDNVHHLEYCIKQPENRANYSGYNDNIIADTNRDYDNNSNRGRSNIRRPFNKNWRFNYRRNDRYWGSPSRLQFPGDNHNYPNM